MKPLNQTLHDFWFEAAPPTRLAMLRILLGTFTLWYLVTGQSDLLRVAETDPKVFAPVGVVFHGPIGLELFHWLLRGTIVAAVCFTLGLWHRFTGPAFAALLLWLLCYRQSWSMIFHSFNLMVLHVGVLGLTRSADVLSLDAFLRDTDGRNSPRTDAPGWQYGWPIKLLIAITVSAYFLSATAKLAGPLGLKWVTGEAMRSQVAVDGIRKELLGMDPNPVAYALYSRVALFTLLAIGSMMLEFFAPLALFNRKLGKFWAFNTFLMHWGIYFVMGITFEHHLSGVLFAPFFRVERLLEWRHLLRRFRAREEIGAPKSPPAPVLAGAVPGTPQALLYYDGECGLCNRFVQFVLKRDRSEYFQFATLQSEAGREIMARLGLDSNDLRTVVLVELGQAYVRSSATLRVCRKLGGPWPLLYAFIAIPKPWRDGIYEIVANHRKSWFKPPAECPVMEPKWRRRFIG